MRLLAAIIFVLMALPAHAQNMQRALVVPSCGSSTLPAGPLTNLTMNPAGQLCIGGSVGPVCPPACMAAPVIGYYGANLTATATSYLGINNSAASNFLGVRQGPSPIGAKISGLQVTAPTAVTTNYYTISLNVNGVSTALKCSFGQPGGVNAGTTTQCSDNVDVVTVNPGDLLALQSDVPAGTATAVNPVISTLFTATATGGQESALLSSGVALLNTSITYTGLGTYQAHANEFMYSSVMPTAGVLDHLYASFFSATLLAQDPRAVRGYKLTIFKNGVATALSDDCTTQGTTLCSDLTDSVSVVAGDTISLQLCPTNAAGCPAGSAPVSGNFVGYSMRWTPTVSNQALLFSNAASIVPPVASTANSFSTIANGVYYSTPEATYRNVAPVLPTTLTLGNFRVSQCPGPDSTGAGGVSRPVTLRIGGVSQTPTVTMPGTAINACPTMTTQADTTHTATAATAGLLGLMTSINTITNAAAVTTFKTSMTVTVP